MLLCPSRNGPVCQNLAGFPFQPISVSMASGSSSQPPGVLNCNCAPAYANDFIVRLLTTKIDHDPFVMPTHPLVLPAYVTETGCAPITNLTNRNTIRLTKQRIGSIRFAVRFIGNGDTI